MSARLSFRVFRFAVALLCLGIGGCQQVTYPDGRVGYNISPNNLLVQGGGARQQVRPGQEANDPYVKSVVPDQAIFSAEQKFYEIGLLNMPATLRRCVADAKRERGNIPECWALDMHAVIANVSSVNVGHRPNVPGLEPNAAHGRWLIYATALGIPPDRYKLVEDGTFQRVLQLATTKR